MSECTALVVYDPMQLVAYLPEKYSTMAYVKNADGEVIEARKLTFKLCVSKPQP